MTEYMYFKNNAGNICRVHLEQDTQPWDPRYDMDGNIGHMMTWWGRGYRLGDYKDNNYKDPEDFLNDLVRHHISDKEIINYVKKNKTNNNLELKYNRKEKVWELWGYWRYWWTGNAMHHGVIANNYPINFLIDDIIESMSIKDKWQLLEKNDFFYLPLYIYEHSGMSISTGGYSDPWDSGQAGWIYTTKNEVLNCGGMFKDETGNYINVTNQNWQQAAQLWLEGEVELYDQYLKGECYGYILDELDMDSQSAFESGMNIIELEDMEWDENTESCWGFFSSKWGNELIEEIVNDGIGNYKLYNSLEEMIC